MGLHIIEHRIGVINAIRAGGMSLSITDKQEEGLGERGTIVRIQFLV
jgi:hypothetical protein